MYIIIFEIAVHGCGYMENITNKEILCFFSAKGKKKKKKKHMFNIVTHM